MFNKILIANRGEIAMRVIRACRELKIPTVAVYTEPDATGIFVKKADEALYLGTEPVQGYLDMERIVQLANETGADAIHPGYGFLAENAEFAWLCRNYGITFIGPSPQAIYLMGNKVQARQAMMRAGVPVVP
ncbi:MAG TPA: acetyl-CoA carboxylase biotin carboxylase subunit, partial [Nitrospirales bacterium]|nr:acetyl-CoA carboxylase biotin carboxylase subunit [Nitrospirales bacterium]